MHIYDFVVTDIRSSSCDSETTVIKSSLLFYYFSLPSSCDLHYPVYLLS